MLRQYTRVVIPSDTASDTAYAWLHPTIPALLCYLISLLNCSFIFWLSFLMSVYLPPSVQCLDAHKSSKMAEKTLYCARLVSYSIASMVVLYLFLYIEHSYLFRCQVFSWKPVGKFFACIVLKVHVLHTINIWDLVIVEKKTSLAYIYIYIYIYIIR